MTSSRPNQHPLRLRPQGGQAFLPKSESERLEFLSRPRLPAILYDFEVAWLLNCRTEDVARLVTEGHLRALGHMGDGDSKRFATVTIDSLRRDEEWINKMTNIIYARRRKRESAADEETNFDI